MAKKQKANKKAKQKSITHLACYWINDFMNFWPLYLLKTFHPFFLWLEVISSQSCNFSTSSNYTNSKTNFILLVWLFSFSILSEWVLVIMNAYKTMSWVGRGTHWLIWPSLLFVRTSILEQFSSVSGRSLFVTSSATCCQSRITKKHMLIPENWPFGKGNGCSNMSLPKYWQIFGLLGKKLSNQYRILYSIVLYTFAGLRF